MNVTDASRVMGLRAELLQRSAALRESDAASAKPINAPDFAQALASVSKLQGQAGAASEAFERGDMTDIAQVMIARQKASVAFEATLQVRNKLLGAYLDIMNMGM